MSMLLQNNELGSQPRILLQERTDQEYLYNRLCVYFHVYGQITWTKLMHKQLVINYRLQFEKVEDNTVEAIPV